MSPDQKIRRQKLLYIIPPYVGAVVAAVLTQLLDFSGKNEDNVWIIGIVLVLPFMSVQFGVLEKKLTITEAAVYGGVGPGLVWLLFGGALALLSNLA